MLRTTFSGCVLRTSLVCLAVISPRIATAQMVTTGVGQHNLNNRFSEQFQLGWGFNFHGVNAQFNGGGGTPPFGTPPVNPGFTSGVHAGPFNATFSAGQFTSLQSSSFTPVVTGLNGYPSSMFIGTTRPFVIGTAPIVGPGGGFANIGPAEPMAPLNPLAEKLARGEFQRLRRDAEELRAAQDVALPPAPLPAASPRAAPTLSSAAELIVKGDAAVAAGKPQLARVFFQLAAARTSEPESLAAEERLRSMQTR